jgi:hypothetical protein
VLLLVVSGDFPDAGTVPCSATGRYVIIQMPFTAILTLCEVKVFAKGKYRRHMARRKTYTLETEMPFQIHSKH